MGKRKKRKYQEFARSQVSSEATIHANATLGPEASEEPSTLARYFPDATTTSNLAEGEPEETYAGSYAELLDKHLFSGRRQLPVSQIGFILLAVAIGWIFIQDNSSGAFKPNDWSAIFWTIQKCVVLASVFFVLFLAQFALNKILNWLRSR